ncbi:30S ribosomal protein S6 [Candidatus Marinamargulisbacteria bacterium SCGC AAA071-K20]|nr:30S ribosomal protein S6 [Candidatus Marinamargulisbacteria bacterium SCGC AAA071-K20]
MGMGYEILYIIKSAVAEEKRTAINDKVKSIIESGKGEILLHKEIGLKELASEFSKETQGYYVQVQYTANNKILDELGNFFHITEDVLRHLNVTLESIQTNVSEDAVADTAPSRPRRHG